MDAGDYKINVSVSDGKYRTFADVRLHVWSITDDMAENAVVIRFKEMPAEEFMAVHKTKLLRVSDLEITPKIFCDSETFENGPEFLNCTKIPQEGAH